MSSLRVFAGHLSDVQCVRLHPSCTYLVSGSSDKTIRLWDVQTGQCVRIFTGHCSGVASLAVCPSGRLAAAVMYLRYILVLLVVLLLHTNIATSVPYMVWY